MYCVRQVVKTPTVILNNPVYIHKNYLSSEIKTLADPSCERFFVTYVKIRYIKLTRSYETE
jgi:hypothetical protein